MPGPIGTRHPVTRPFRAFPSAAGHVVMAIRTVPQWERFVRLVGREAWLADPRFKDKTQRTRHHAAHEPLVAAVTRTRATADWLAALEAADVPCAPTAPNSASPRARFSPAWPACGPRNWRSCGEGGVVV